MAGDLCFKTECVRLSLVTNYVQRWALCSNCLVKASDKQVEVIERSYKWSSPFPAVLWFINIRWKKIDVYVYRCCRDVYKLKENEDSKVLKNNLKMKKNKCKNVTWVFLF